MSGPAALLAAAGLRSRAELALENLALRQQLATLRRTAPRPQLRRVDRAFWIGLSQIWSRWANALVIVKPDTVVRWHRAGFRLFWRWKSRSRSPAENDVPAEVKQLIRRMAEANVGWGAPRIHGELLKLGIDVGERSVSPFMPRRPREPPSQSWRTFLDNHLGSLSSIDFFAVPTATFRILSGHGNTSSQRPGSSNVVLQVADVTWESSLQTPIVMQEPG